MDSFWTVNTSDGEALILFQDQTRLAVFQASVQEWANRERLVAATMSFDVDTLPEAVERLRLISPSLNQTTILRDDSTFVSQLLLQM